MRLSKTKTGPNCLIWTDALRQ